jgi:hypothetical protein
MPRRNRRDERAGTAFPASPTRSDGPEWAQADGFQVRHVGGQKPYRCPGCEYPIRVGAWHLVVVPADAPDERRHWHTECWRRELRRTRG